MSTFAPKTFKEAVLSHKPLKRRRVATAPPLSKKTSLKRRIVRTEGIGRKSSTVPYGTNSLKAKKAVLSKRGPRADKWLRAWRWLKPRLEAAERVYCEFDFLPHRCWGRLDPCHSKKRRLWEGNDIYAVAIGCQNIHQLLDESFSHERMETEVMKAIERHGGLIAPDTRKPIESLEFYVPIKLISEANRSEHWSARMRRKHEQQLEMTVALHNTLLGRTVRTPCVVKLTRIGPKLLDKDNLAGAFKFVQDAIASKMKVDDGDRSKIDWQYDQVAIGEHRYNVKVQIECTVSPQAAA